MNVRLDRARDAPIRFLFATLAESNRFWFGIVIVPPLVFLLLSPVHGLFVSLTAGLPFGIALWLLWLNHQFVNPQLRIDTDNRILVRSQPYNVGNYSPVEVDNVDQVLIIQFSDVALIKLQYFQKKFSHPPDTPIASAQISEVKSQLEQMDLDVSIHEITPRLIPTDPILARIVVTPLVILGTPLIVWYSYGIEAFLTDVVIVPMIVMIGYGLHGEIRRYRFRRSNSERGQDSY
jgi:hypothetical protein